MNSLPNPCPICREEHEPRGLSFDGKGINSCGMYRARLATFTSDDAATALGNLFAAAPELLAALEETLRASPMGPHVKLAQAAIRKAKGGE